MAISTGRVENIIQIIGKDAASAEIDKAIKSLERMKKKAQGANEAGAKGAKDAASAFQSLGARVKQAAEKFAPLAVAAGVAFVALSKIWESSKEGAKFLGQLDLLQKGVEGFGAKLHQAEQAAAGTISKKALVEGAAVLKNFGISLGNFDKIAEQVAKTSVATGQSTEHLLASIATGVARNSPMILDNLGIQVKLSVANEEYARSLGKTVKALTDAEKKTALMNATLKALEKNNIDVNLQDARSASINRTQAAWDNFTTRLEVGSVAIADAGISFGGFIDDTFGFLGSAFPRALEQLDPAFDKLNSGIEASTRGFEAFKQQQKDVIHFDRLLRAGFTLSEAGALLVAQRAREAAVAEHELAVAGQAAAESQAAMAENMKRAADEAAGFALLLAGDFTGSTKNTKKRRGGGSMSEETKQARALAKALRIARGEARKLVRALEGDTFSQAEARTKAHEQFVQSQRDARKTELEEQEAFIDAGLDLLIAGHEAEEAEKDKKSKAIIDANKKERAAIEAGVRGGVAAARQAAELIGLSKGKMATIDGLIQVAESIASFAAQDYVGGAQHALAAAAFFKAAGAAGAGGGARGSGGSRGAAPRSAPISSANDNQQGGGTTIVNFQGFAVGSAAQLGSELSGALGAVRGTGQDRAAAV